MKIKRFEDNTRNSLHFDIENVKVMELATMQVALVDLLEKWESQRDLPEAKRDYHSEDDIERLKNILNTFEVKNVEKV